MVAAVALLLVDATVDERRREPRTLLACERSWGTRLGRRMMAENATRSENRRILVRTGMVEVVVVEKWEDVEVDRRSGSLYTFQRELITSRKSGTLSEV